MLPITKTYGNMNSALTFTKFFNIYTFTDVYNFYTPV